MLKNALIALIAVGALAAALLGVTASAVPQPPQYPPRQRQSDAEREMEERQQKEMNKRRQAEIQQDTQKLYDLAGELKDAVGKSNENLLSLDVVRKAEEVEKLARRVKDKMREGTGKPFKVEPPPVDISRPGVN